MNESVKDLTSIIITAEHEQSVIQRCLDSIEKNTKLPYEIIVVEDGTTKETIHWLAKKEQIKLIRDIDHLGFLHSRNLGTSLAEGDVIVYLQDNTVVYLNWLEKLRKCLFQSKEIAAAGPVTNAVSYYQKLYYGLQSEKEWEQFAIHHNSQETNRSTQIQKLDRFCLAIKKEVIEKVGLFHEQYGPIGFEDNDLSLRFMKAGYKIIICNDVFVYCDGYPEIQPDGSNYVQGFEHGRDIFLKEWGFDPSYSMISRYDLIGMMDQGKENEPLKILEIGCGSGATLLTLRQIYPNAELHGIEISEGSAQIANLVADVVAANIEKVDLKRLFQLEYFDYIICGDVLEHLVDPWTVIHKLRALIKNQGYLLLSIPNIMHISIIQSLLLGKWTYQSSGILDQTHLRFFTLQELEKIFTKPDYDYMEYQPQPVGTSPEEQRLQTQLAQWNKQYKTEQMSAYQYRIKARVCHASMGSECGKI